MFRHSKTELLTAVFYLFKAISPEFFHFKVPTFAVNILAGIRVTKDNNFMPSLKMFTILSVQEVRWSIFPYVLTCIFLRGAHPSHLN